MYAAHVMKQHSKMSEGRLARGLAVLFFCGRESPIVTVDIAVSSKTMIASPSESSTFLLAVCLDRRDIFLLLFSTDARRLLRKAWPSPSVVSRYGLL